MIGTKAGVNTSHIGAIGEHLVIVDLMKKGYEVFRAVSPGTTVDLIVQQTTDPTWLRRVEVTKGKRRKNGDLRWQPHKSTRYDWLAVWEDDGTITYVL
jgi:hypothetical protein